MRVARRERTARGPDEGQSVPAGEFGRRIAGSRVEVIAECGHVPQMEQLEQTVALVREFLG
jgi:pimeloyl-ACP methyl ester carboxylesterase